MKLTDKQIDKITALCEKWHDCVPDEMSNGEVMMATGAFIGMYLFGAAEDVSILDNGLDEIVKDARKTYLFFNKKMEK